MSREWRVKGSFRKVAHILDSVRSWQRNKKGELRCAVVRHAERADACWQSNWCMTGDAAAYPFDPPLTAAGIEQAQACGARLRQLEQPHEGWKRVICSPFLRCVQTGVEICKATGASLIIDQDWGEVRFPDMIDGAVRNEGVMRTYEFLARYVAQEGVKLQNPGAPCGSAWDAKDPETIQAARERYARKFVVCLDRAMLSRTNFIVVTHGESLPSCLGLFPEYRGSEVISTPFCGMVVGRLEHHSTAGKRIATQLDSYGGTYISDASAVSGLLKGLSVIETNCEVRRIPGASEKSDWGGLPAWMRSKRQSNRGTSLLKAFGVGVSNPTGSTDARSREVVRPAATHNLDEPGHLQELQVWSEELTTGSHSGASGSNVALPDLDRLSRDSKGTQRTWSDDRDEGADEFMQLEEDLAIVLPAVPSIPAVSAKHDASGASSQLFVIGQSTMLLGNNFMDWSEMSSRSCGVRSPRQIPGTTMPFTSPPGGQSGSPGQQEQDQKGVSPLPITAEKELDLAPAALERQDQTPTPTLPTPTLDRGFGLGARDGPGGASPPKASPQKWSIHLPKNRKGASVVPLFEDDSPRSTSTGGTTRTGSALTDSSKGVPLTGPFAAQSEFSQRVNLSKVATNSLFQRRRRKESSDFQPKLCEVESNATSQPESIQSSSTS